MFKKKVATQAAKAAVGVASAAAAGSGVPSASSPPPSSSTSSPTAAVGTTAAKRRSPSRGSPGAKARTLALIEKHRKLLEEAQQQKEEMENITQEQTRLQRQQQQQQQQGNKKGASSSASLSSSSASASRAQEDASASPAPPAASRKEPTPAAVASPCPTAADAKPDAFTALIDQFLAATQPLADLDETIQVREASTPASASPSPPAAERPTPRRSPAPSTTAAARPPVLTHRSFAASLTCPKKFYLFQNRTDLIPKASVGDVMHFDDSVGFNELARRWDRLQFGSRAKLVRESDFGQAVQRTEDLIVDYFQGPHAALGEQAPTLTIHRPAFAVGFPGGSGDEGGAAGLELRARPTVLRYRPKENQWVFIDAQAVIDPVSTSARITHTIQKFHFSILCFRLWLTQPHLPIELRKKFFQVDLDGITEESLKGHSLESSARPAAPVDMKRSGLLHIRQFFPGPATLVDCPPPQLVKFIQRLSLEELLEEDGKHYMRDGGRGGAYYAGGAGGAFDLRNCHSSVAHNTTVKARVAEMDGHARELGKILSARTVRSQKHKDETLLNLFEAQQRVVHDMLRHHTVPLMKQQRRLTNADHRGASTATTAAEEEERRGGGGGGAALSATDAAQLTALTAFSGLLGDEGFVRASQSPPPASDDAAETGKGGKKGTVKAAARKLKGAKAKQKGSAAAGEGEEEDGEGGEGEAKEGLGGSVGAAAASPPCYGRHIGPQCVRGGDACPFFVEGMCLPRKVSDPVTARDNHLFTLPSTSLTRKSAWWAEGKRTIRDVLTAYERATTPMRLTHAQLRYAAALTQGQVALNPDEIDSFFAKIRYPLFVIDFEAVQFALPPFQKEVAYQSIPFQFSLDVFQNDVLTEEPTHYNYLHFGKGCSPNTDPRPSCVAELLRIVRLEREKKRLAMESTGELARLEAERLAAEAAAEAELAANSTGRRGRKPKAPKKPKITKANPPEEPQRPHDGSFIAHFASFEKSCLEKLGQLVEEYKEEIKEFYFLDTLDLIKKGCVHPNAHGSNSLKKVLPALCPDFQYGVFGSEVNPSDDLVNGAAGADGAGAGGGGGGAAAAAEGQDEQKGENAMGVYRLWYHLEGGGTVQDLQRASRGLNGPADPAPSAESTQWSESVRTTMTAEEREQMWETLRTQLLEYCSLDTKALYEIMREIHHVRDAIDDDAPRDKNGWVYIKPVPREMDL